MRAGDLLSALRDAPLATLADKACGRGILIVAPHQDDESLGCGGLIVQAVRLGLEIQIIFVTDGAGSHPNSAAFPPKRLRKLREMEALEAARRLGLKNEAVHFLRLPDRFVEVTGEVALAASDFMARLADEVDAGLIFTTWYGDPHCDHKAAWILARNAARLSQSKPVLHSYIVWGWVLAAGAETGASAERAWRLDVTAERSTKALAIEAHTSQLTDLIDDDPTAFRLDDRMIERFRGCYEYFFEEDT